MIKNSVGYNDFLFWQVYNSAAIGITNSEELDPLGTGSGFIKPAATSDSAILYQEIPVINGETYTISCYANKRSGTSPIGIEIVADGGLTTQGNILANIQILETNGEYQLNFISFEATGQKVGVRVIFQANTVGVVTGLMLNLGVLPFVWSTATGETYNTNVRIDLEGIRVAQMENDQPIGYTKMTPSKFAAYYDVNGDGLIDESKGSPDEVFRMDKDEFVMNKAVVQNEITMGTIKVIKINTGGNNGWAFISNEG